MVKLTKFSSRARDYLYLYFPVSNCQPPIFLKYMTADTEVQGIYFCELRSLGSDFGETYVPHRMHYQKNEARAAIFAGEIQLCTHIYLHKFLIPISIIGRENSRYLCSEYK